MAIDIQSFNAQWGMPIAAMPRHPIQLYSTQVDEARNCHGNRQRVVVLTSKTGARGLALLISYLLTAGAAQPVRTASLLHPFVP